MQFGVPLILVLASLVASIFDIKQYFHELIAQMYWDYRISSEGASLQTQSGLPRQNPSRRVLTRHHLWEPERLSLIDDWVYDVAGL